MASALPLSDIKVLDFFWVLAGPGVTRSLADYGATVIRVEATNRTDPVRTVGPFLNNKVERETSALWWNNNAGKYGVTIDMSKPEGKAVALDLVRWADIVTESFSPKAMKAWGMDYESLRKIKPDIIMISSCLMGQTGPLARFAGFGNLAAALCGFYNLVGWPDRQPSGPFSAYTDYIAPRFGLATVLAALIHRKQTGEGQYIDQAQAESALQMLTIPIVDSAANGREYPPVANRDLYHAPHGVYPAAGDDRWIAIACRTEAQWQALTKAMGQSALAQDSNFATFADRQKNQPALDEKIAAWTRSTDPLTLQHKLQDAGVPAHVVANTFDMTEDPQLKHRSHFVQASHGSLEKTWIENSRYRLSRTPAPIERGAPTLGEHNQHVLEHILGYSEERIVELVSSGALGE
ncbi:MAG TPA: CoA transferase [Candidatus Binataceae bacterium]|nr:CoA transferase [Candidatus Binataceae bacterium]